MPSPGKKEQRNHRSPTPPKGEELLSSSYVQANVNKIVMSTIEKVAEVLKQIPRAPEEEQEGEEEEVEEVALSSKSETTQKRSTAKGKAAKKSPGRSTLGEKVNKKPSRERDIFESPPRSQVSSSSKSTRTDSAKKGIVNECSECGDERLPLPFTHGVFANKEPIYCRDRYFMCQGKNMYTRQIFAANGEALKPDFKKLNELRGCPTAVAVVPVDPDSQNANEKMNSNGIVVAGTTEGNAKGVTLKFNVKMIKPDGTPKVLEVAIEMPDFEPSFVKVGDKTAFLE